MGTCILSRWSCLQVPLLCPAMYRRVSIHLDMWILHQPWAQGRLEWMPHESCESWLCRNCFLLYACCHGRAAWLQAVLSSNAISVNALSCKRCNTAAMQNDHAMQQDNVYYIVLLFCDGTSWYCNLSKRIEETPPASRTYFHSTCVCCTHVWRPCVWDMCTACDFEFRASHFTSRCFATCLPTHRYSILREFV